MTLAIILATFSILFAAYAVFFVGAVVVGIAVASAIVYMLM